MRIGEWQDPNRDYSKAWGKPVQKYRQMYADIKCDSIFVKISPTTKHYQ